MFLAKCLINSEQQADSMSSETFQLEMPLNVMEIIMVCMRTLFRAVRHD